MFVEFVVAGRIVHHGFGDRKAIYYISILQSGINVNKTGLTRLCEDVKKIM